MNWAIYKKGFKAFLQLEKSLSAHSVEAYLRDIDKLTNYLESIGKLGAQNKMPRVMNKAQAEQWTSFLNANGYL